MPIMLWIYFVVIMTAPFSLALEGKSCDGS